MKNKRYVEKTDIQRWKHSGLAFLGVGILNAAMGLMILKIEEVSPNIRPILLHLIGGTA